MSHKAIPDSTDEYCGTSYAAKLLNLSVGSIQSLVEKNELFAWKTQGGHRRISLQSIYQYQSRANLLPKLPAQSGKYLKVMVVEDDANSRAMYQAQEQSFIVKFSDETTALTTGNGNQYISPVYSPDGKYVVTSRSGGTSHSAIIVLIIPTRPSC
jgi:excisionase family DNA binding protein